MVSEKIVRRGVKVAINQPVKGLECSLITFLTPLIAGETAQFQVTTTQPLRSGAVLSVWFDFNLNGTFDAKGYRGGLPGAGWDRSQKLDFGGKTAGADTALKESGDRCTGPNECLSGICNPSETG